MNLIQLIGENFNPSDRARELIFLLKKNKDLYDSSLKKVLKRKLKKSEKKENIEKIKQFNLDLVGKSPGQISKLINLLLDNLTQQDSFWTIDWTQYLYFDEKIELNPDSHQRFMRLSISEVNHVRPDFLENLLKFSPGYISILDSIKFIPIMTSQSLLNELGYVNDELSDWATKVVIEPDQSIAPAALATLSDENPVVNFNNRLYSKNKSKIVPVSWTCSLHAKYIYAVGQDMSQLQIALVAQANQIALMLSHDVGNKLAGMIPLLDTVKSDLTVLETVHLDMVEKIKQQEPIDALASHFKALMVDMSLALSESECCSRNGLTLLRTALKAQELEAKQKTLSQDNFFLDSEIMNIFNESVFTAKKRNIEYVYVNVLKKDILIKMNKLILFQVISNVLHNAFKFVEDGDFNLSKKIELKIELSDDRKNLIFTIQDNGVGMTPSELPAVFEKFQQANDKVKEIYGGSGVGLFLVRKNVQKLKGTIKIESEGLHRGTRVIVQLPYHPVTPLLEKPVVKSHDIFLKKAIGPYHILIAEDNELNQKVIKQMMKKTFTKMIPGAAADPLNTDNFFVIEVVSDGQEAIDAVQRANITGEMYDFIFVDNQMKTVHGIETIQKIKTLTSSLMQASSVIMLLTASVDPQVTAQAMAAGADGILDKPMKEKDLHASMNIYLENMDKTSRPLTFIYHPMHASVDQVDENIKKAIKHKPHRHHKLKHRDISFPN